MFYIFDPKEKALGPGEAALIPANTEHAIQIMEELEVINCKNLAMICSPEEILIKSLKPGIFIAECDFERIRWLREQRDLYGPPMPWRTEPGVLRDWRRPEVFRKNFPDW